MMATEAEIEAEARRFIEGLMGSRQDWGRAEVEGLAGAAYFKGFVAGVREAGEAASEGIAEAIAESDADDAEAEVMAAIAEQLEGVPAALLKRSLPPWPVEPEARLRAARAFLEGLREGRAERGQV